MTLEIDSTDTLVIRTDFTDDSLWASICESITAPVDGMQAYVHFVDDSRFDAMSHEDVADVVRADDRRIFFFIVDAKTMTDPDHPILAVDLDDEPGRPFRVVPSATWMVENNLSIANMDWEEFAENVDDSGVFRGGW